MLIPQILISQQIDDPFEWAEKYYGTSDLIVNGSMYIVENPGADGTPLFGSGEWFNNTRIYIKGNEFKDEALQYNLEFDFFILKKTLPRGEIINLKFNNLVIDSVRLNEHLFVNSKNIQGFNRDYGFVELIYFEKAVFFIKHNKEFLANYSEQKKYGEYSKQEQKKYLLDNNQVIQLNSKRSFLKHFESIKPEVKKFMKKQNIRYKKASANQLRQLLKFCYDNA